jgi:hypothetical protein
METKIKESRLEGGNQTLTLTVTGISLPEITVQAFITNNTIKISISYKEREMINYYYYCDPDCKYQEKISNDIARDANLIFTLRGIKISTSGEKLLPIVKSACQSRLEPIAKICIIFNPICN